MNAPAIKIQFDDLKGKSAYSYCRKLIKQGVDPSYRLEVYRQHPDWDFAITSIGEGSKLMIVDSDRDGLYVTKYPTSPNKARQ